MKAKPHVSAAIKQLRVWVSFASIALCAALGTQMLVFGFVHYTDIRWTTVKSNPLDRPLMVVDGASPDQVPTDGPVRVSAQEARAKGVRDAGRGAEAAEIADVNRVLTGWDRIMHVTINVAMTAGVVAAMTLAIMCALGVVIAGGGSVPGVERAVTAATWSFVLLGLCLPLRDVMQTMPFPGIFSGYKAITGGSEAARAGGGGEGMLLLLNVVLPAAAVAGAAMVRYWFNEGVERGVIYTSVSEIDEAMEKEMAQISASGPNSRMPRAMGALNRAMGDSPTEEQAAPPVRLAAGAESVSTPALLRARKPDPDDFKRPI